MLEQLTRKEFINNIISENKNILENHMKKNNIQIEEIHEDIKNILYWLKCDNIHLEKEEGEKEFQIKDVLEYLPVKLGYFKIEDISGEADDPERRVEQCPIIPTEKGKEIYAEYRRLRFN